MTKLIRILAVIAVVQVLFMIMTWMGSTKLDTQADSSTLLTFNSSEINRIVISGHAEKLDDKGEAEQQQQSVTLSKQADKWQTDDTFPANNDKVKALLDKLKGLEYSLPVATTQQALTRFKVADDDFERLIELKKDDKTVAKLYLGTGAGVRQSHARRDDQAAVYSVTLGAYDAPIKRSDWQDQTILHLDKATITKVELADLTLQADDSAQTQKATITLWKADTLPDDKLLNQKAINDNLPPLFTLGFTQVLGKESKPEYGLDKPVLDITVHDKKAVKYHYQLGQLKDSKDYVLKRSDRAEYFKIAEFVGKPLVDNISKEKWLLDKAKPEETKDAPVTPEPTKVEPAKVEPATTAPATVPATSEPAKVEPATTAPATMPATPEPAKVEPATTAPATVPVTPEPAKVEPTTQPTPSTEPVTQPVPATKPEEQPAPATKPVTQPTPATEPTVKPAPATEPVVQPIPDTAPATQPTPVTAPAVQPVPDTAPATQPVPVTTPAVQPAPVTAPVVQPVPDTAPVEIEPTTETAK